jgi:hypothetical protein
MYLFLSIALPICSDIEIERAIAHLSHPTWRVRQAATVRATSFSLYGITKLKMRAKGPLTLEARRRFLGIIDAWYQVLPTRYPLGDYPRILHYPKGQGGEAAVRWHRLIGPYIGRAIAEIGTDGEGRCERYATQLFVRDLLNAGRPRSEVLKLINRMTEAERRWWIDYGDWKHMPAGLK